MRDLRADLLNQAADTLDEMAPEWKYYDASEREECESSYNAFVAELREAATPGVPRRVTCPYPMLPEEYAAIVNASGISRCPNCGNEQTDMEYRGLDFELGMISQRVDCHACDFSFFDVYHLVRYDPLETA